MSRNKTAIIGYTWFVGSNLDKQFKFSFKYNSKNIKEIENKDFDLVVCAWVKSVKRRANQNAEEDLQEINKLIDNLKKITTKRIVLISTIDVYKNPNWVDENSIIDYENNHAYWKNRYYLEDFIKKNFTIYHIIRLPWLFWDNIKKNVIFDLLNNNQTEKIIPNSKFQYYYLGNIRNDIQHIIENNIWIINLSTEPIETQEMVNIFFKDSNIGNEISNPVCYDFRSIYAEQFWWKNWYLYDKWYIFAELRRFIKKYKNAWN